MELFIFVQEQAQSVLSTTLFCAPVGCEGSLRFHERSLKTWKSFEMLLKKVTLYTPDGGVVAVITLLLVRFVTIQFEP